MLYQLSYTPVPLRELPTPSPPRNLEDQMRVAAPLATGTACRHHSAEGGRRLMASVFLSYDHEDPVRAAPIAAALEAHGHSVWWDRHIHGGAEYDSEIEGAVERAQAVIVLWSQNSVRSAWVRDEAAEGRDAGKLIPILIDNVKPPMGFRQYQAIDLAAWTGGRHHRPPSRLTQCSRDGGEDRPGCKRHGGGRTKATATAA